MWEQKGLKAVIHMSSVGVTRHPAQKTDLSEATTTVGGEGLLVPVWLVSDEKLVFTLIFVPPVSCMLP